MKTGFNSIVAILLAVGIVTSVMTVTVQSVSAPRECPGCQQFKKLTHEFEKSVIKLIGTTEDPQPHLRELLQAYVDDVNRIFLGGPDTIPGLLEVYQEGILYFFQHSPSGHKMVLHDQIIEFRELTHGFEKAVLRLFTGLITF